MGSRREPAAAGPVLSWARRQPAWLWAVAVGVLVVVLAGVFTVLTQRDPRSLDYQTRAFRLDSASEVELTFEVDKLPAATAVCRLRARAVDSTEVGSTEATIGPRTDSSRRTITTVRFATTAQAVTAEVDRCRITSSGG